MITDPVFYAVAIPALLVTGISKGGFGSGIGILAVPAITLTVSPVTAAAIVLPILCAMDLFGVWGYRGTWDRANMKIMVPGAVLGIGIGVLAFGLLDERWIGLIIGLIAVSFSLLRWLRPARGDAPAKGPDRLRGTLWSMTSGFTSFISHAGGPPIQFYLLPQRMDKTVFVGTTVIFFLIVNYVKLGPYIWLGLFDTSVLTTALVLSPIAPVSIWLGMRLHKIIPPGPFYRICYVFVFLAGLKLLYDNVAVVAA
ncbi:MAG: sulfite exporter TauE/SafE family protein [Rhodospirillaceae bacterium]|jgi:uncharacterized protein|nr:sulfite exporter TauE/SafE family protein [Rhodospirillaceae bacterium]MBT6117062.1 sulfite exporter TauE/SafE family protein [Rhodospirillaceae bacterium]